MVGNESNGLEKYGGEYFPFALVGIAFTRYFQMAIDVFTSTMRRAQMVGCLEAILSSQSNPKSVVLFSSIYSFISAGVQLVFMFIIAALFLGFSFSNVNILPSILAVVLSIILFISLGIFSASGTIIFKKGEPFGWFFGTLSALFGGAFFPIEVMPDWMQAISIIVPITYSLEALRLTILQGHSILMVSNHLIILGSMSLVLFPLSLKTFQWAVEKGKRDGSLMDY